MFNVDWEVIDAGLISRTENLLVLMDELMFGTLIKSDVVKLFTVMYNETQSSRALGWDTNSDSDIPTCGTLSKKSYMHTGFTGTSVCNDPDRQVIVILLTNRVYPTRSNLKIKAVRNAYATAVQTIIDGGM